jgi:hypothetical protein
MAVDCGRCHRWCRGEKEYLFSVFTVSSLHRQKCQRSTTPTQLRMPQRITLVPAVDNQLQPDGQPWPDDLPPAAGAVVLAEC